MIMVVSYSIAWLHADPEVWTIPMIRDEALGHHVVIEIRITQKKSLKISGDFL